MARNGSGTYTRTDGVRTGSNIYAQQESAGVDIEAGLMDTAAQDIADALTASIAKDGQTSPSADLPMNGFIHTGVGTTDDRTGYAKAGELADGTLLVLAAAGTNTLTASATPTITAYVNRQTYWITIANKNTSGTVTLNIDSVGAHNIVKPNGNALDIADLQPNATYAVTYYTTGTEFVLHGVPEVDGTTITSDSTTGILGIPGGGVDSNQLNTGAVTPAKTSFANDVDDFWVGGVDGATPASTKQPTAWGSVTDTSATAVEYPITHNLGSTNYIVLTTGYTASENIYVTTRNSNDFRVKCYNETGPSSPVDTVFSFQLIQY